MAIELLTPFTKVELEPEIKDKKRKQVGILGGNFNPVHNAHLIVADQVRQQLGLDQVLLMPEYQPPHVDKKETIPEHHRLKMLELAIDGIEGLAIETIELERNGRKPVYLFVDESRAFSLKADDKIQVRRSKHTVRLVRLSERSFCEIFAQKMLPGGFEDEK